MTETIESVVGMGVPSKYFDLPLASFGRDWTVTLKRARRERPQRTKKVRIMVSRKERKPRANAHDAGAIPKEILAALAYSSFGTIHGEGKGENRGGSEPNQRGNQVLVP